MGAAVEATWLGLPGGCGITAVAVGTVRDRCAEMLNSELRGTDIWQAESISIHVTQVASEEVVR